jgi:hypothetical protein
MVRLKLAGPIFINQTIIAHYLVVNIARIGLGSTSAPVTLLCLADRANTIQAGDAACGLLF